MQIKTKIWTDQNDKKIPVCLMENNHLLSAYTRLTEISFAKRYIAKNYKNELEDKYGGDSLLYEMDSEKLDEKFVEKWVEIFKEEINRRKLNIPKTDRLNIDAKFKAKQIRKKVKIEQNKKFDAKFK